MTTPISNDLAAGGTMGSVNPFHLFAGEKEVVTAHDMVAANTEILKYQLLGRVTTTGFLVPHDPEATDGSEKIIGVATQPIKTTDAPKSIAYYVSGFFNHEALVWHDDVDTLVKRKAAVVGTEIQVGTLYGGDY